jgi:pyruvate dehydrogenase E1 component
VPGWVQLHREGLECDEWNLLHPHEEPRVPWVTRALGEEGGPVLAVTDFLKAVPMLIAPWVPAPYATLGTDGFGRSDTRPRLRHLFRIDPEHIALTTLGELAQQGALERKLLAEAIGRYGIDTDSSIDLP